MCVYLYVCVRVCLCLVRFCDGLCACVFVCFLIRVCLCLCRHTPHLVTLNLRKNSICEVKNYRQLLVRRLALLETLDGLQVTTEERIRAGEKMSVITQDLVLRCGRLTVRVPRPPSARC